jgi:hypothetical protein
MMICLVFKPNQSRARYITGQVLIVKKECYVAQSLSYIL